MNFSEPATGGILYSQESCRPVALLKTDSETGVFFWILRNFSEHLFRRTSANGCFWFFKTATKQRWAAASVLTHFIGLDNLLTGYE